MTFAVIILPEAEETIFESASWWATHRSRQQAERWFDGIYAAIDQLQHRPERCPLAREHEYFATEIRELHFGLGSRITHRVIFTVRGNRVFVLAIRHASQDDLKPGDLDLSGL